MNQKMKAVLLDIGDVLLHVDWSMLPKSLGLTPRQLGGEQNDRLDGHMDVVDIRQSRQFIAFENGKMSPAEFFSHLKSTYSLNHSFNEMESAWNSVIVSQVEGVESLIKSYSQHLPFFALTNASAPHIEIEAKKYPLFGYFKKIFTSYDLGYRKPDKEIYLAAIAEIGCLPSEILFVDDLTENIAGGRSVGLIAEECKCSAVRLGEIFKKHLG